MGPVGLCSQCCASNLRPGLYACKCAPRSVSAWLCTHARAHPCACVGVGVCTQAWCPGYGSSNSDCDANMLFSITSSQQLRLPPQLSPACTDLLQAMLQRDPAQRATAAQLLQHPFITRQVRGSGSSCSHAVFALCRMLCMSRSPRCAWWGAGAPWQRAHASMGKQSRPEAGSNHARQAEAAITPSKLKE